MDYRLLSALATVLALFTSNHQKDENMDHDRINSLFHKQSKTRSKERERELLMMCMEEKKEEELQNLTKTLEPQLQKNFPKLHQMDVLFYKPSFTAFSLDTLFFFAFIHICGAGLVGPISTVTHYLSLTGVLDVLVFSLILPVYAWSKWKREKAELEKKLAQLQNESLNKDKDQEDVAPNELQKTEKEVADLAQVVDTLNEVKTELEEQRDQLKRQLEEIESEKEKIRTKLQTVEAEITEREKKFDKPEKLIRKKEKLLQAQWKQNETKKICERQILNLEKVLEPIENHRDSVY